MSMDHGMRRRQPAGSSLELYVNQYVPSTLASPLLGGLSMQLRADFFGRGTTATANLTFSSLPGSLPSHAHAQQDIAVAALPLHMSAFFMLRRACWTRYVEGVASKVHAMATAHAAACRMCREGHEERQREGDCAEGAHPQLGGRGGRTGGGQWAGVGQLPGGCRPPGGQLLHRPASLRSRPVYCGPSCVCKVYSASGLACWAGSSHAVGVRVAGDAVRLTLPMAVRAERVQDDRPEHSSLHVGHLPTLLMHPA
jgi:hypothetical protein